MTKLSIRVAFDVLLFAVLAACAGSASGRSDSAQDSARAVRLGDTITQVDTAPTVPAAHDSGQISLTASTKAARLPRLSAEAQRIAEGLVFVPRSQTWFLVAVRARRLLVDLGRADVSIGKDTALRLAYVEAAKRYSPLPTGAVLRLHGPWGVEDATVGEFDTWNGRIVARVRTSPRLDTLVRRRDVLLGVGMYVDSATLAREDSVRKVVAADSAAKVATLDSLVKAAGKDSVKVRARLTQVPAPKQDTTAPHDSITVVETCSRDSVPPSLAGRVLAVRDSIERWLNDSAKAPYPRLEKNSRAQSWAVPGCYGIGRVLVLAGRRNPTMEFSAERALMVSDTGAVLRLRLSDLRFHFHEPLAVFDADGDGIDDLATRALGDRSGGLSIMRLDTATKRLQRLASGFAWETL